MQLKGAFRGVMKGTYPKDDPNGTPYCLAKVKDVDSGAIVKIRAAGSDDEEVAEFADMLDTLTRGASVEWIVQADAFGKLRFVSDEAA